VQKVLGSLNVQESKIDNLHKPVLLTECLEVLNPQVGEVFVDATLGLGGHSEAILLKGAKIIGIDQDLDAIGFAKTRLSKFGENFEVIHANFSEINQVIKEPVDGILADLGVSSLQFDSETRGFSFRFDAPLDMRMDANSDNLTAAELLETLSEFEIARIIYEYGEERFSRRIARNIVEKRERGEPIKTTKQLVQLIGHPKSKEKIHPATRTFQALRIAVNGELDILQQFINDCVDKLKPNGRLAIISFHSLEDRIIKQTFQKLSGKCTCPPKFPQCFCGAEKKVEVLTRKPLVPNDSEINENQRARSAKLRSCMKLLPL
jgi:16S rRNA (cytosine1402-N4)-methyltransferase